MFIPLLTPKIIETLPALYSQEGTEDPTVHCKFFDPCSNWTWFVLEFSQEEGLFFGVVVGHEVELGYFSLADIRSYRSKFGLGIERDTDFEPCPLSRIYPSVR